MKRKIASEICMNLIMYGCTVFTVYLLMTDSHVGAGIIGTSTVLLVATHVVVAVSKDRLIEAQSTLIDLQTRIIEDTHGKSQYVPDDK